MGNVTNIQNGKKEAENVRFARKELEKLLKVHTDAATRNEQAVLNKNIMALVNVFAGQNHTNETAYYVLNTLQRLLSLKPLSPIMGTADEWIEVTRPGDDLRTFQNKRCPSVFKKCNKDGMMLDCIDQDGIVLSTDGGFSWFTSARLMKHVQFPYMPGNGPEQVFVREDKDGTLTPITDTEEINALYDEAVKRAEAREKILR